MPSASATAGASISANPRINATRRMLVPFLVQRISTLTVHSCSQQVCYQTLGIIHMPLNQQVGDKAKSAFPTKNAKNCTRVEGVLSVTVIGQKTPL
jgi:hypothetical protein